MTDRPPQRRDRKAPPSAARPSRGLTEHPGSHAGQGALLFVEIVLALMLLFSLFLVPVLNAVAPESGATEAAETSVFSLFILTLGFQVIQGCYPWIHARRRGRTIADAWGFVSRLPNDIAAGMVMAMGCFGIAYVGSLVAAALVGLDDTSTASNTDILVDNRDSPWIVGVILLVVVGAPLVEELLFRGLVLRTLEGWFGTLAAVVGSSLLFAIPHWQSDATWQETIVLLTALGGVGFVLALGTVYTNRLGPAVIAHFLFNATGTLIALFA